MTALSDPFFADVARMGQRRRTNPVFYVAVWCAESGLDPAAVNPNGGARGLNQMMPATLQGLGAPADYEKLAGEEQLPWIERLVAQGERLNGGPFESAARYYHSNFYPKTMARGASPDTVVVAGDAADADERAAYAANKGLDANGDGRITLSDLAAVLERALATRCQDGIARLERAVDALPPPGRTWTDAAEIVARRPRKRSPFGAVLAFGAIGLAAWRTR
jgi:Transglycosylase SLT domain